MDENRSAGRSTTSRLIVAILAGSALILVALTTLNQTEPIEGVASLEHAQKLAQLAIEKIPISQVPLESELESLGPEWELKSDHVIGEKIEDDTSTKDWIQPEADLDDDIDSPINFETDHRGNQFVPLIDDDIEIDEDSARGLEANKIHAAKQQKIGGKCGKKQKICATKRQCERRCIQKCNPIKSKPCTMKLHCRCWCKCGSKVMKKHKCIIYKKSKKCVTDWRFKCRRRCKKFCKRIPKCYCCKGSAKVIRRRCYRKCRRITVFKRNCGRKCSCLVKKCAKTCEMYCLPKK